MAGRDDISVLWHLDPRLIFVAAPSVELVVQDLHDTLRDLEDEPKNMVYPSLITSAGGENLGGGVTVGLTSTLINSRVGFDARKVFVSSGTITTPDITGRLLIDSAATFQTDLVAPGSWVVNITDGSICSVLVVVSQTELITDSLGGGSDNQFDSSDTYRIMNVIQMEVSGGNLVAVDAYGADLDPVIPTAGTQIVRTAASSATTQNQAQLEYSTFNGSVTISYTSSYSGTSYPIGTQQQPVNNLADAVVIAATRGFNMFNVVGDYTFLATDVLDNYIIVAQGQEISTLTLTSGVSTNGTIFRYATVQGEQGGEPRYERCEILSLTNVHCFFENCSLVGPITSSPLSQDSMRLINCFSGHTDGLPLILDLNNGPMNISIRNFYGAVTIENVTDSRVDIDIDMGSGYITLDTSITNGNFILRGTGLLEDNSTSIGSLDFSGLSPASYLNEIQFASFEARVFIDAYNGQAGTDYPIGTRVSPVNNLSDALSIAATRGFDKLSFDSNLSIGNSDNVDGYHITSDNRSTLTLTAGCSTNETHFQDIVLSGQFGGEVGIENSTICSSGVSNFYGTIENTFIDGTITVSTDNTKNAIFSNCFTGNVTSPPIIDCGGDGAKISLRGLTGAALFTNKTGSTQKIFVDLYSARVGFASSITAGTITVRGVGYIYLDDSSGATFDLQGLVSKATISDAVWEGYIADHDAYGTFGRALGFQVSEETVISGGTSAIIQTNLRQADDFWNDHQVVVKDATTNEIVVRNITDYAQANGALTLNTALPFTPEINDSVLIFAKSAAASATVDNAAIADAVWEEAKADHTDPLTFGGANQGTASVDAYQIADAVWTTQASGYFNNDGAFGQVLGFTLAANATITNAVDGYTIETTLNEPNDYWNNHQAVIYDISAGTRVVRNVTSYLQSSGTITFSQTLPFTAVSGDLFMAITRSPATGTATATVDNNAIATAVWNKPTATHTAEGTFGRAVGFTSAIETTVTGGTATTITTGLTQADNFWDEHQIVIFDADSGEKVVRNVVTYLNSSGSITFNEPLPFTPSAADPVLILARSSSTTGTATVDAYAVASAVWEAQLADHADPLTFGSLQFGSTDGYSIIPDTPTNTNVTVTRGNFANIMVNGVGPGSIRFVTKGLTNHAAQTNKLTISVQKRTVSISIDNGQNFFVLPIGVHTLSIGWIKQLMLSGQGTWEVIASFN